MTAIGTVPATALPMPDALDVLPAPAQSQIRPDLGGPLFTRSYAPGLRPEQFVATWTVQAGVVPVFRAHRQQHATATWQQLLPCRGLVRVRYSGALTISWLSNGAARVVAQLEKAIP